MNYCEGNTILGLSDKYKFGIEIEADNVDTKKNGKSLYHSKESDEFFERVKWKRAGKNEEELVSKGGAECISPILHDTEEDWQNLIDVCEHIKKYPGKKGDEVVANEKCGCHIHFDAGILDHNPQMMKNFLTLYIEAEELIYKMCNEKGNPMRKGAFTDKKSLTGLIKIARKQLSKAPKGMAGPTSKKNVR